MMKSLPELMKGQCRSGSERTHFGMCGKPAAGRRTPETHTGHRWMTGIRFMRYRVPLTQGDAVDEPGSSIGRLRAGRHVGTQMAAPRRGP